jgi:peroxiredoxin
MSLIYSTMQELGSEAPQFDLPAAQGGQVKLADFADAKGLMVVFMCNHCPYVKHIRTSLADFARDYQDQGISVVAINANDVRSHPADSPERMAEEVRNFGYVFPYLYDESQQVARAYGAVCTPDFFLYDGQHRLVYRGQFDDSRPGNGVPVTGAHLRSATDALLAGEPLSAEQTPSVGCNIKWKPGNEPD